MASRTAAVAFEGAEAKLVEVQVQLAAGAQPVFSIVGLGDKAVAESRERVRAAFLGLAEEEPDRIKVVDAAGSLDVVQGRVADHLEAFLEREVRFD